MARLLCAPSERLRAGLLSVLLLSLVLGTWHLATSGGAAPGTAPADSLTPEQAEYLKLMGKDPAAPAAAGKSGFPTPAQMGRVIAHHAADPFYDNGPNDKGLGLQLAHSLGRVGLGYLLAALAAIPLGFAIGMSPLLHRALDPFIQVLKPISPLAWMPLALYTIKDSGVSGIFVIFICSVWPMLINTAFGVAGVRREWLNVSRTLEVKPLRRAFLVVLPAAAPTILTGMRISMGIAWLVIVAAEMLVGGTGIGYFVWNEWNNLSLPNVVLAILGGCRALGRAHVEAGKGLSRGAKHSHALRHGEHSQRRISPFSASTRRAGEISGARRLCRLVVGTRPTPRRRLPWPLISPRRGPVPKPNSLLVIGLVGMALDMLFARLQKAVTYVD